MQYCFTSKLCFETGIFKDYKLHYYKMKIFQNVITGFRNSRGVFSLKTYAKGSPSIVIIGDRRCVNNHLLVKSPALLYNSISKFHTAQHLDNEVAPAPLQEKRFQRKKVKKVKPILKGEVSSAVAYSSAEQYKMAELSWALENLDTYERKPLPPDAGGVLYFSSKSEAKEKSHIYFFSEGSVVFWNVPAAEQKKILNFIKPYESNSYDAGLIFEEKEDLDFTYSEDETSFYDGSIILNSSKDTELYTYTFSNSLGLSVKLGMLESSLEKFCDSIEWVTEKMKKGEKIRMSRNEILVKRGELFALRHVINLGSDYLDTPDFYWDRKDLEILYQKTCNYLDIAKRTKTMNERLSYCSELIDLLGNHMNDEHHVRLEWMIIILIMVEVVFECVHFLERFSH